MSSASEQSMGTFTTVLLTFKTAHSEYDAVIICDLSADPVFREIPLDFKDARKKGISEIFGYDPTWELKGSQRVLFREVIENPALPPSQWAVFARVEKGVERQIRNDVCRTLSAIIRKYRGEERRHYYIKNMVNNWLEKLAKGYNYPQRDPTSGKFQVTKFGKRLLRGQDEPFPHTDTDMQASTSKTPGKKRGGRSPMKPQTGPIQSKSPAKKPHVPSKRAAVPLEHQQSLDETSLSDRIVAIASEQEPERVATRPSPRKQVTQLTGVPKNLELLTSSRAASEAPRHRSPLISPIPVVDASNEQQVAFLRNFSAELIGELKTIEEKIISKQQTYLADFCMASLPETVGYAIDAKFKETVEPMRVTMAAMDKVNNSNETRILALIKLEKDNKKTLDLILAKLTAVQENQASYDRRLIAITGVAAEKRSECTDLIAKVLPFRYVGPSFDILMSADIFRKYCGYYIQPKLDSLPKNNLMNATAHTVVNTLFTPIASAHLAFGEGPNGISKMHYFRRALPKAFGDFVLSHCVTYVRRANNITASTKVENYAKCHGGMQIKFSNDRQKVVRTAAERCATSKEALDLLFAMDEEYIEDMMYAIPKGVKTFDRATYDSICSKVRELKALIDAEARGAKPQNKVFPRPAEVFEPLYRDAGIAMDDRQAYEFIATLAKASNMDPASVRFSGSQYLPNVQATYLELLNQGMLDIDGACRRFNVSQEEDEVAPMIEDDVDDEEMLAEEPQSSGKRKIAAAKTPTKRNRVALSHKGLAKAAKAGNILTYQDASTTQESTLDDDPEAEDFVPAKRGKGKGRTGIVVIHDDTRLESTRSSQSSSMEQPEADDEESESTMMQTVIEHSVENPALPNPNMHLLNVVAEVHQSDAIEEEVLYTGAVPVINQEQLFQAMVTDYVEPQQEQQQSTSATPTPPQQQSQDTAEQSPEMSLD